MREYVEEQDLLNRRAGMKPKDNLILDNDEAWKSQSPEELEAALQTWEAPSRRN